LKKLHQKRHLISSPVVPSPELLPLNDPNFGWEKFEAFCEDFISKLPGVKECHRYGTRGSKQKGIDIYVDLKNGERWTFQCRQRKRFKAAQAKKTIKETSFKAHRHFIVVTSIAGSRVRDVFLRRRKWGLWDLRDISRNVRNLPADSARHLVQTHFDVEWRKRFLGLSGLTPFIRAEDYFRQWLRVDALFNHAWALVGRKDILKKLTGFVQSSQYQVAILVGRGGIGKSKILHSFSKSLRESGITGPVWFVEEGVPITPETADELPTQSCVVVADDAHRYPSLAALFALAQQRSHDTKLVLSIRPHALEQVRSQLTIARFDSSQILQLDELKELSLEEVRQLARQALGKKYAHHADRLATITRDSPLVTVVGGQLIARKRISPDLFERDQEFRQTVLTRFGEVLIGKVSVHMEPHFCRSLLELVAATAPIRPTDNSLTQAAAEFLEVRKTKVINGISMLEMSGVLIRRGYTLRITPDVLADHLLHEACVTVKGDITGYAEEVFEKFRSICLTRVLRNLAELDWRIGKAGDQQANLLSGIWSVIEAEFTQAANSVRCQILESIAEIAYYQPVRALRVVELAMQSPNPVEDKPFGIVSYTQRNVLEKLPIILRNVGFNLDHLPYCCDLLWELGKDDGRPQNSEPYHPIRVLKELARFDIEKPLTVNHYLLVAAEKWLKDSGAHDHVNSPIDLLDEFLQKNFMSVRSDAVKSTVSHYGVDFVSTKPLRDRSLALIAECSRSENCKVVLRVIQSFQEALREPMALGQAEIPQETKGHWLDFQLEVLQLVDDLSKHSTNPLVHLKVMDIVSWHARHSWSELVKKKAAKVSNSVPKSHDLMLTRVLARSHEWGWEPEEDEDAHTAHGRYERRMEDLRREVAEKFLADNPEGSGGAKELDRRLHQITDCGLEPDPGFFLQTLSALNPEYAAELCNLVIECPDTLLVPHLSRMLENIRKSDQDQTAALALRAMNSGHAGLERSIANYFCYGSGSWTANPQPFDIEMIKRLLGSVDLQVRKLGIGAIDRLGRSRPREAVNLALAVEIGTSTELGDELCEALTEEWATAANCLSEEDLTELLRKLETLDSIDTYHIGEFISCASGRIPDKVVDLFLRRIERDEEHPARDHAPYPYSGFRHSLRGLEKRDDYEDILRKVRDHSLVKRSGAPFWFPKLFRDISLNYGAAGLTILQEWIDSDDPEKISGAAVLLREADTDFIFAEVQFVSDLLEKAHTAGNRCYESVTSSLYDIAISGTRSGAVGLPFAQDVSLKDQADATAKKIMIGSPTRRFYESVAQYAQHRIRDKLARDEELINE
jgi:hypothetical protein